MPMAVDWPMPPSVNWFMASYVRVPEREMTPNELHAELMGKNLASKAPNDRLVMLEVGEEVPYQRYYQVVTMISEAGGVVAMIGD